MQAMTEDPNSTVHYLNYVNFKHSKAKAALQWAGMGLVPPSHAKLLPNSVTLHHDWSEMTVEMCGSVPVLADDEAACSPTHSASEASEAESVPMHTESDADVDETDMPPWMVGEGLSRMCSEESDLCGAQTTDLEALFDSLPMMIPC